MHRVFMRRLDATANFLCGGSCISLREGALFRAGANGRWSAAAAILFLALAAGPAVAITNTPTWETPEFVFENQVLALPDTMTGQDRFLDFDNFGSPGVVAPFRPGGAGASFWIKNPGGTWNVGIASGSPSTFVSFSFDRSERPIVASIAAGQNLRVSRPNLFGFDSETVTLDHSPAANTALAIDPLGRTGVAYVDSFDNLRFTMDLDGNGVFDDDGGVAAVAGLGNEKFRPSLAFDPQTRPMIAYIDGFNDTFRFDVGEIGVGFGGSVFPDPDMPGVDFVSLAVNPLTGYPGIAYNDRDNNRLKYAEFDGDDWNVTVVHTQPDGNDASDMSVSLAFDPADGRPAIAFTGDTESTRNALQFAWFDGGQWNTQTVDDRGNIAKEAVSLAFNQDFGAGFGDGLPAIAYFDAEGYLRYVEDPLGPILGDMTGDGEVNLDDARAFVLALTDAAGFAAEFPGVDRVAAGDVNGSGSFDLGDVGPFKSLLAGAAASGSASQAVPEPSAMLLIGTLVLGLVSLSRAGVAGR